MSTIRNSDCSSSTDSSNCPRSRDLRYEEITGPEKKYSYGKLHGNLVLRNKRDGVKHSQPLAEIHQIMRQTLDNVASYPDKNIAIASLGFFISIKEGDDRRYDFISLCLQIPHQGLNLATFSKTPQDLAAANAQLAIIYDQGVKVRGSRHGDKPDYRNSVGNNFANKSARHSEQLMATYLTDEATVKRLFDGVVSQLKAKGITEDCVIKIYNISLHIHSSKTPCKVCETVLSGLLACYVDRRDVGLTKLFQRIIDNQNSPYTFSYPGKDKSNKPDILRRINMRVTYTAHQIDAGHQTAPRERAAQDGGPTEIDIKLRNVGPGCEQLYVLKFQHPLPDQILVNSPTQTLLFTVFGSGTDRKPNGEVRDEYLGIHRKLKELHAKEAEKKKSPDDSDTNSTASSLATEKA